MEMLRKSVALACKYCRPGEAINRKLPPAYVRLMFRRRYNPRVPQSENGCVDVLISATPAQLARWNRKCMESRRAGDPRASRSREIRRDGLLPGQIARDLSAAASSLRRLAVLIGAGELSPAAGSAQLLALADVLQLAQQAAAARA